MFRHRSHRFKDAITSICALYFWAIANIEGILHILSPIHMPLTEQADSKNKIFPFGLIELGGVPL